MSSYVDHFVRDIAGQLSATICLPKEKPAFEIFFPQAEWQVLHGHRPGIAAWPTNKCFQKVCDDFQVVFPIYRTKYRNWKEYCNARWNYHRSYAYRLIDYAKAVRAAAKVSTNGDTKPKALKTEGSFRASQKAEKQAKQKQSSTVSSPGQAGFRILPSQVVEDLDVESEFTKIREQVELWAAKFTQSGLSPLGRKGSQLHEWDSVRSGVHGRPTGSRGGISMSDKWDFLNLPIQPNDNFDLYWRWIVETHRIFEHRLAGDSLIGAPPGDKFLSTLEAYAFCNPFRVLDQGSQNVIYLQQASGLSAEPVEVFFRTALYRAFNSPDPLAGLIEQIGDVPSWQNYDFPVYSDALAKVEETNGTLYRGAYMFNDSLVFGGDRNSKAYLANTKVVYGSYNG